MNIRFSAAQVVFDNVSQAIAQAADKAKVAQGIIDFKAAVAGQQNILNEFSDADQVSFTIHPSAKNFGEDTIQVKVGDITETLTRGLSRKSSQMPWSTTYRNDNDFLSEAFQLAQQLVTALKN